jgi:two-component system KDP operon response regulator KdpE
MSTIKTRRAGARIEATVLIVDASVEFTQLLRSYLERQHYHAITLHTGREAMTYLSEPQRVDAILLDVSLPDLDGWETCRCLRQITDVPILILTELDGESNIVRGFDLGADDYLVKPFHFEVLKARLTARLRRARVSGWDSPYLAYCDDELYIDLPNREVWRQGQPIHLTPIEFRVLASLVRRAGGVVKHKTLLREVWGRAYLQTTYPVKLYVGYLRRKIEPDPSHPRYILSEWGQGYRFCTRPITRWTPISGVQMERSGSALGEGETISDSARRAPLDAQFLSQPVEDSRRQILR